MGDIPLVTEKTPDVTAENIEEVYSKLFPSRDPVAKVYEKIITDLEIAVEDAPEVNSQNKFLLSKAVANALLAKVYAEKPVRDYNKVIHYCNEVRKAGFSLVQNYDDLFSFDKDKKDATLRNSSESFSKLLFLQVVQIGYG